MLDAIFKHVNEQSSLPVGLELEMPTDERVSIEPALYYSQAWAVKDLFVESGLPACDHLLLRGELTSYLSFRTHAMSQNSTWLVNSIDMWITRIPNVCLVGPVRGTRRLSLAGSDRMRTARCPGA